MLVAVRIACDYELLCLYRAYNDVLIAMLGAIAGLVVRKPPKKREGSRSRPRRSTQTRVGSPDIIPPRTAWDSPP